MRLNENQNRGLGRSSSRFVLVCLTAVWSWAVSQPVQAQATGPQQTPAQTQPVHTLGEAAAKAKAGVVRKSVPLDHLYWHFFVYQQHLDQVADSRDQQGKDGRWLRNHFQTELRFSDVDFAAVRSAMNTVIPAITQMGGQARSIRTADHLARKRGEFANPADSPGLAQLKQLNKDRDDLLHTTIATMNSALGPAKANVLAEYLQKHLAANVQVLPLPSSTPFPELTQHAVTAKKVQP